MTTNTGTYTISDLLATRFQSVAEFGMDTIVQVLQDDLAAHNAIVTEMVSDMCEVSTDRQRIYGTSQTGEMVEVDEFGKAPTQNGKSGATVGFPLKLFQYNIGWTSKWMQTKTPADMAQMTLNAEDAHMRKIQLEIKKAGYISANYTHRDHLVDNVDLLVKRFVNADSADIPNGPNGEAFDGATHTHYNYAASLNATDLLALVNDVVEHGHGNRVLLAISRTDEVAVSALSGFKEYRDSRLLVPVYAADGVTAKTLDVSRLDNRAIGIFGAAEVWVKPWAIASYPFCWDAGASQKPFVFRQRTATALQGLRISAANEDYPLYAQFMEAEFGIGVWSRTNGGVYYTGSGSSYTDPTITA